jgi:hypothetical protein
VKVIIITLLFYSIIFSQNLQVVSPAKVFKGGRETHFNPIIEKESLFGAYQLRKGQSQKLFLFSLRDENFNEEIVLNKKKVFSSFGVTDDNEVFLAPFIGPDKRSKERGYSIDDDNFIDANFAYTIINQNGKYQVKNNRIDAFAMKLDSLSNSKEYNIINFPYLSDGSKKEYISLASSEKDIIYSNSGDSFKDMQKLTEAPLGAQDIGPVLSPNEKYIAFTRIYANENKSAVIVAEIKYSSNKLSLKRIKEISKGRGIHCQSPSWSPDSKHIAYYSNEDTHKEVYSIFVTDITGRPGKRVARKALRKTLVNRGPTWVGKSTIVYVKHEPLENFPIYYTNSKGMEKPLGLKTTINKDISVWEQDGYYNLIFTSIGKSADANIIYNKIFTAKVKIY